MILIQETKERYGYHFDELSLYNTKLIIVQCDFCGGITERPKSSITLQRKKSLKDTCGKSECRNRKLSETKLLKSGVELGSRRCSMCKEIKLLNSHNFNKAGKRGFRHQCVVCTRIKYHNTKRLITEKIYSFDEAKEIYDKNLEDRSALLPPNFFERIENKNEFFDYIFKVKTDMYKERFTNFNQNFVTKYKLHSYVHKHKSLYEFINKLYPSYIMPWELKKATQHYWKDDNNVRYALEWFIMKLFEDNVIESLCDLPKITTYKLFEEYKLGGLLSRRFNASPFQAINFLYPDKFSWHQFNVPKGYYSKKENRINIINLFIETLIQKGDINSIEEIPLKVNISTFDKYGFKNFLLHCYQGVSFSAFNDYFPGKWKIWEFKSCPTGFWESNENVKDALLWFIDRLRQDGKLRNINELPKILGWDLLQEYNISTIFKNRDNVYKCLLELFPLDLNKDMFSSLSASDGTRCDSMEEVLIYNFLLSNNIPIKYTGKKFRIKNKEDGESYCPDWIINDNIIVEYFGLYTVKKYNNSLLENYREKTHRKVKFYNSLEDYKFIPLYKSDLKDNFYGLIEKFNKQGIVL